MAYEKGLSNMLECIMKVWKILQILITVGKKKKKKRSNREIKTQALNIVVPYWKS